MTAPSPRPDPPPLRPALAELVALLAATRGDWPPEAIRGVLIDLGHRGVAFAIAMRESVQLACIPGSDLGELRDRHPGSDPLLRHRAASPDAQARAAQQARATLTTTRKETSHHDRHQL